MSDTRFTLLAILFSCLAVPGVIVFAAIIANPWVA
jgi:hypothetical protein